MALNVPSSAEPLAGSLPAGRRWYQFFTELLRMVNAASVRGRLGSESYTIASGVITITAPGVVSVDTQSAAATDDLDTITYSDVQTGDTIILVATDNAHDVVVKDATGNIRSAGDFTLTHGQDTMMLVYTSGVWCEVSRSDNTA